MKLLKNAFKMTPKHIVIYTTIILLGVTIASYFINAKSLKLPAAVKTDMISVSAKTAGNLKEIFVSINQEVKNGDILFQLANPELNSQIADLEREKSKYKEFIKSASEGNQLTLKLMRIDEDLLKSENKLNEVSLNKESIQGQLLVYEEKFQIAKKEFETNKKLFSENIISSNEFDEKISKYLLIHNEYNAKKNRLKILENEFKSLKKEIAFLEEEKILFSENVSLIVADYLLKLEQINSRLNAQKNQQKNLQICSPIDGFITDILIEQGEFVGEGNNIAELSSQKKIWIIAYGNANCSKAVKSSMKVAVYCSNGKVIYGKVNSIAPIMERIKSLSGTFETVESYTKIEIFLDDLTEAKKHITPGEKINVRIFLN